MAQNVRAIAVKVDGYGQAKVLSQEEIAALFNDGFVSARDRALFAICLYAACRVNEACALHKKDAFEAAGKVRSHIVFRKPTTKGKLATRVVPICEDLRLFLLAYHSPPESPYLFPAANNPGKHIWAESASRILKVACQRVGIEGVSTHSFRRTSLTQMSDSGIPLRVIQKISGHRSLDQLQRYLDVSDAQVKGAIASLCALSPVRKLKFPNINGEDMPTPQPENLSPRPLDPF